MDSKSFVVPHQPSFRQRLKAWHWKTFKCPKGTHADRYVDGSQANYCGFCGKQMVQNPVKTFVGILSDGKTIKVEAIHEKHALDLIVYGPELKYDLYGGGPISPVKIHPHNIVKLEEAT